MTFDGVRALPRLRGSHAQISWANDLRLKFLVTALQLGLGDEMRRIAEAVFGAGWWLDRRDMSPEELIESMGPTE